VAKGRGSNCVLPTIYPLEEALARHNKFNAPLSQAPDANNA
jgi:hypothetical protein